MALCAPTRASVGVPVLPVQPLRLQRGFAPPGDLCPIGSLIGGFFVGASCARRPRRICKVARAGRADLGVGAPPLQAAEDLPRIALTRLEQQQLLRGERVQRQEQHGREGRGVVVVDVAASPSTVLGCLGAFGDYASMIPVVKDVEVKFQDLMADGTRRSRCSFWISRFCLKVSAVLTVDPLAGIVSFDLDPEGSQMALSEASGVWRVEALPDAPGRTRVWLHSRLRACPLLPLFIVEYAAQRALTRATSWLKPHLEGYNHSLELQGCVAGSLHRI